MKKKHLKLLQTLLDISGNRELVAALLNMDKDNFSRDHIHYMLGPVVVHPSPWSENLPDWLIKAVYKDRLEQIFAEAEKGVTGEFATESEVMAFMYAATLDAPMSHDWVQVYLWCGNIALTRHGRFSEGRTFWEMIGSNPIQLSDYQRIQFLQKLQRDIRRIVVKVSARRERVKTRKRSSNFSRSTSQVSLFDLSSKRS
ncbi:hypothetical protein ACFLXQ_04745 [Chloroflexota bacterium]